ncbi:Histone-lysine N-methyltransferase SETMAR like protein [Argiope bruennichi]|uniref:Histone-lysine N-methyltransferase SETMAR like protein n=1 Tax=Argiope bruennichi TaxID=94029 RepID=A0A8T0FUS1_ARGBR|nr:Histone-lysine N-methyltransferase SETMAR like protein [Argiope bruennichi]
MLFHFEKGWKATQSFRDPKELFGDGTINGSLCREWFARLKSGDTSLEEKPKRYLPSVFDDQALLAAIEGDESLETRILADNSNVDHSTNVCHLKKLGKIWKLVGWVLHKISDNNKAERVRIFTDLLQRNERGSFLKDLVTEDKSWLIYKNLKRKKVWVSSGVSPKGTKDVHCKKALQCVWWARSGIDHWEIIFNRISCWWNGNDEHQQWRIPDKNGKRQFNNKSDVYLPQLDRFHAAIETKRPKKNNHFTIIFMFLFFYNK